MPALAEIALRAYHFVRVMERGEGDIGIDSKGRAKLARMLLVAHSLLASNNVVKTALHGWNPTALNLPQFLALGKRLLSVLEQAAEKDALDQKRLAEGWEALLAECNRTGRRL